MTNKTSKSNQYYQPVTDELKGWSKQMGSTLTYDLNQARQKFKRWVSICREAALKIKTASGIQSFLNGTKYGSCFKKLFEFVMSMDNCQHDQVVQPDTSTSSSSNNPKKWRYS